MGTLTVQTLQAPTSGANANKVLIPSGHTLDASNGLTTPAGHVVQYIPATFATFQTRFTTTSNSYATSGYSLTITPKSATNLILISYHLSAYVNSSGHYIYSIVHKSTTSSLLVVDL